VSDGNRRYLLRMEGEGDSGSGLRLRRRLGVGTALLRRIKTSRGHQLLSPAFRRQGYWKAWPLSVLLIAYLASGIVWLLYRRALFAAAVAACLLPLLLWQSAPHRKAWRSRRQR
jgi:hypothetical protein